MITVHQVWANYPDSDLLGLDVDEGTTVADVEEHNKLGDTLFLALVREVCESEDVDREEAVNRIQGMAADLDAVAMALQGDEEIP